MNAYFGADTEALRTVSSAFARRADLLSEIESQILAVIDGTEWIGEDAEAFRADWAGRVRPVLQDCSVDIRHSARRLLQHAEEQDRASSPESPAVSGGGGAVVGSGPSHGGGPGNGHGTGGGVSGAGADAGGGSGEGAGNGSQGPLARMGQLADKALHALAGDRSTPFQQLLGHLMDSPAGRAGLIAGMAGGMLGGLGGGTTGDMVGQLEGGDLGEFLTGLGIGHGLGALLGPSLMDGSLLGDQMLGDQVLGNQGVGDGGPGSDPDGSATGASAAGATGTAHGQRQRALRWGSRCGRRVRWRSVRERRCRQWSGSRRGRGPRQ